MKKKVGLGRNLNALLGGSEPRLLDDGEVELRLEKTLKQLPIEKLQPGGYQPRRSMDEDSLKELSQSIIHYGVIQPVVVRPVEGVGESYEIIAGERRWRAAKIAGLEFVPVVIKDIPNQAALAVSLIENIQREELNPLEEARAYKRLLDEFDLTHQQVSDSVGKSRTTITNMIRILNLEQEIQQMLERGDIDMGHAKVLLSLHGQKQLEIAKEIVNKGLTVRDAEKLVKGAAEGNESSNVESKSETLKDPSLQYYEERLYNRLGSSVSISKIVKGRGKVTIEYTSTEDLEKLLGKFSS